MIIRIALAVAALLLILLVLRNLGVRAEFRARQRKAWDEPLREGSAVVLAASPSAWWWLIALGAVTAVAAHGLWDRVSASGHAESIGWWLVFLALAGVTGRRLVQLSERVTVTWDRITSRNLLGERYAVKIADVTGVSEDERTTLVAFRDGRVLEISPWLDGRFWLARELRARLEGRGA